MSGEEARIQQVSATLTHLATPSAEAGRDDSEVYPLRCHHARSEVPGESIRVCAPDGRGYRVGALRSRPEGAA